MKEEAKKKPGKTKKKEEFPLPDCTTAPDPEHQRAENEDEPCNDARGTEIPEDEDSS